MVFSTAEEKGGKKYGKESPVNMEGRNIVVRNVVGRGGGLL